MIALIKAAQLILSLSILVVLHELGHFLPAKYFKTRVEKFYLFFNPGFSLFKRKIGETEYGIGWLPLGGYVKIAGMVDESMDTEALSQPVQPWEFRSKPAWQRLIIMLGGVTVNLILGFFIYAMVLYSFGDKIIKPSDVTYGLHVDSRIASFGFEEGDKILALDGKEPESYNQIRRMLLTNPVTEVSVERSGQQMNLTLPSDFGQALIDSNIREPFAMRFPTVIDVVTAGSPAEAAGLLKGDSLVGVNDIDSPFFNDLASEIRSNVDKDITIHYYRNGVLKEQVIHTTPEGTIGFGPVFPSKRSDFNYITKDYTFFQSFGAGFTEASETLQGYVLSLRFLFSKSGASQIGSFITIGSIFDAGWDWQVFWRTTAFLSLILAFMNLLPIPALDGGHVVFLLYEIISGRPASQKFLERAQMVGVVILLTLMVYAIGNDIYRWLTNAF
ncbi:MAG: RIP metalloprotease RseP [Cryomorphaceae bacterium]|nr:RIP metalloprotease RseP [Cryomorphaceae bacterium]